MVRGRDGADQLDHGVDLVLEELAAALLVDPGQGALHRVGLGSGEPVLRRSTTSKTGASGRSGSARCSGERVSIQWRTAVEVPPRWRPSLVGQPGVAPEAEGADG